MMSTKNIYVTHYMGKHRHWCPRSEKYTGLDSLLSALLEGWTISKRVYLHRIWRGARPISVYYFELKRDDEVVAMPILENPYLATVIAEYDLQVIAPASWEKAAQT